ncbi:MAG: 5-formyltetrahydrofolate cyclo-ligase [Phycisphaerales bacterium JB037]
MSAGGEIAARKRQMRAEIKRRLAGMTEDARRDGSRTICERIVDGVVFARARTVMMYLPLPNEVDPRGVGEACFASGRSVVVPRIGWEDHSLTPCVIGSFEETVESGRFGVREPAAGAAAVEPGEIDLVLVPGLAFDDRGGRLGRGAGFYDRFLRRVARDGSGGDGEDGARRSWIIGVAFDEQMVESVPGDAHDHPMDWIMTPTRDIRVG